MQSRHLGDFIEAIQFVWEHHGPDLEWIKSRQSPVETFQDFYHEYTYVVMASGFRARIAARFVPLLIACEGDLDQMLLIFKNRRKCEALAKVWAMRDDWLDTLRPALIRGGVDGLVQLPHIGPIVKYHLGRNLGLCQSFAKPDIHLVRYVLPLSAAGDDDKFPADVFAAHQLVQRVIGELSKHVKMPTGVVDFIMWIWLSHDRGNPIADCCGDGGHRLR